MTGDTGGTRDDLALIRKSSTGFEIVLKQSNKTSEEEKFSETVNRFLDKAETSLGEVPDKACFAVAGPVKNDKVNMPNADLTVSAKSIKRNTDITHPKIVNDFEALGYGVDLLEGQDTKKIQDGKVSPGEPRGLVGAGTGLGKALLVHDEVQDGYVPLASEGGHSDFPITSQEELELAKFIKNKNNLKRNLVYEDLVSGRGLKNIYNFYSKDYESTMKSPSPKDISQKKDTDKCSRKTFDVFKKFYARCCKNYILETLPRNGLFIGGGIAAKNPGEFDEAFLRELKDSVPQFKKLVSEIKIELITNYDMSLVGAARAFELR